MIAAVVKLLDGARGVIVEILRAVPEAPADARAQLQHAADALYELRARLDGLA